MMTAMLLTLLMQSAPQDSALDERIIAFVRGDVAAQDSLLKLGAFAIRPLQKARGKSPEKIDALISKLKSSAMFPIESAVINSLGQRVTLSECDIELRDPKTGKLSLSNAIPALPQPHFIVIAEATELRSTRVTFLNTDAPARV